MTYRTEEGSLDNYNEFASVYDSLMEEIPYGDWADGITKTLEAEGFKGALVLDLGCGTGKLTRLLCNAGFDMIGVDGSVEMLDEAKKKESRELSGTCEKTGKQGTFVPCAENERKPVLYLNQELTEFELYGTVGAVVSTCDTINYLTEKDDLQTVFKLVENYLDYNGLFLFDVKTLYTYNELLGDGTFYSETENACTIWENEFDKEEGLNYYDITIFKNTGNGLFRKHTESHVQRFISREEIERAARSSGLIFEGEYSDYNRSPVSEEDERRVYILRKKAGNGK